MAVTDSTGQHGPWSDQLTVTYDGMNYLIFMNIILENYILSVTTVPDIVSFIVQLQLTNINVLWQV